MNPKLDAPPIIEVMCGVLFEPVPHLDPIAVGGWWQAIKADFPTHSVQPAVTEAGVMFFGQGAGPLRAWLISKDDEWVIQVQPDRFYMNWRKRDGAYPRFNGDEGVLKRALREFDRFTKYCGEELSSSIRPNAVELAKVDSIVERKHWADPADLGTILPIVADVGKFAKSPALGLGLNVVEPRDGGVVVHTSLQLVPESIVEGALVRVLKVETRATRPLDGGTVAEAFVALNDHVNGVFFGLLSPEGVQRFNGGAS